MFAINQTVLRPFEERDVPTLVETHLAIDVELAAQATAPRPRYPGEFLARIRAGHLGVANGGDDDIEFAIARADDPKRSIVGVAGLYEVDLHNRHAEIGVTIGDPKHRGLGIGIDAYVLLTIYGLRILGLNKVYGFAKSNNAAALGTMERMGLKPAAVQREHRWVDGEWVHLVMFELLASEWSDRLAGWRSRGPADLLGGPDDREDDLRRAA